jgi:hypothetical protein
VNPASSCSIRGACGRRVSPLTPDPSPLPGERGAGCGFQGEKQTLAPLSPSRGEGMGVRGQRTLPRASLTLPRNCESSVFVQYPWCVWQVRFTPHPRPLSPSRGEGKPDADSGRKADSSPLSPSRGEGMGVRGQRTLPAPRKRFRETVNPASSCTVRGACGRRVLPLTPDPSPLPGERGAGCGFRAKSRLYPPSPL